MSKQKNDLTYTLTATPSIFLEGQFIGKMKNVTFVARCSTDTQQWLTVNCGQFEKAFVKIMSPGDAKSLVAALIRGEDIEFPGLFMEQQFVSHFVYEHSGVY